MISLELLNFCTCQVVQQGQAADKLGFGSSSSLTNSMDSFLKSGPDTITGKAKLKNSKVDETGAVGRLLILRTAQRHHLSRFFASTSDAKVICHNYTSII